MRLLYFIITLTLLNSCAKEQFSPVSTSPITNNPPVVIVEDNFSMQTTEFNFAIPNIKVSQFGFRSELSQATSSTILYSLNCTISQLGYKIVSS